MGFGNCLIYNGLHFPYCPTIPIQPGNRAMCVAMNCVLEQMWRIYIIFQRTGGAEALLVARLRVVPPEGGYWGVKLRGIYELSKTGLHDGRKTGYDGTV